MKAVILAGGVRSGQELAGTTIPRALWPFPSEPVIAGVIRFLKAQGIDGIAICANGKTRMIAAELSGSEGKFPEIHYSEDSVPRGPAGCLKDLQEWLGAGPFMVIQGTGSYNFNVAEMLEAHQKAASAITVGAMAERLLDGSLEPAGVYMMEPRVLDLINALGYQDIKEQLLPRARQAGMAIFCHRLQGSVYLIHGCEHYLTALEAAIKRAGGSEKMVEIRPGVWAHETAQVDPTARFSGTVWLERNVSVEAGAVVVGPVLMGEGAMVGKNAIVHRVAMMKNSRIAAGAEVCDAVYAPNVTVGSRLERVEEEVQGKGRTGLRGLWARTFARV